MASNKDNMKLLLKFLAKILEGGGNEWFHDELAILISKKIISEKDTNIRLSAVTVKEFGSIDKYLNEKLIPIIDYSLISDNRVKFQLERDSIEMGKSRLSNFSETISFESFCKYAHFQSEELINYYYQKISNGFLDSAKSRIKQYNTRFDDRQNNGEPFNSLSSIPHSIKQFAISKELNFYSNHNFTLSNIAKVRNLEIHRNSAFEIDEKLKNFLNREDYNQVYESIIHLRDKVVGKVER